MEEVKKVVAFVFGTRPEAIKMAPLIKLMQGLVRFKVVICVTGQHREMLDQVMDIFDITPDYNLNVMSSNQTLTSLTASVLSGLDSVFSQVSPDMVFVHGDTSTTLAASLAAYYKKIPIGHVEAGLRTGDIYSPWPEEANRKLTGGLASLHFAPTERARSNLLREGVSIESIHVTGNTVIDALHSVAASIKGNAELSSSLQKQFAYLSPGRRIVLVTGHRRESFGQGFENICHALRDIATQFEDVDIVYPVHLNPQVREPVNRLLADISNIYLIEPLDYLSFVYLMMNSCLILTDSGGVQEEAPSLGKPVLIMRDTTERPEALTLSTISLVGTSQELIVKEAVRILSDVGVQNSDMSVSPFGDGSASKNIVSALDSYFKES